MKITRSSALANKTTIVCFQIQTGGGVLSHRDGVLYASRRADKVPQRLPEEALVRVRAS